MARKGFEMTIGVIITIVVLIVVALAVITIVLGNIRNADNNLTPTTNDAACGIWKEAACGPGDTGTKTHPNLADCQIECSS
ncbi:MAG: hypothetical protein ABIG84_01435 [archaeon]